MLPLQKTPPKKQLADFTVLLYGKSKFGKSEWCSHADNALFLATEAGLNSLEAFQLSISKWEDLLVACKELSEGQHQFKTVIIDTVDNAYRMCAEYVCQRSKVEHESDLEYGKGYALVNNEFFRVLTKLSLLPYGLILVSHSQEKEFETRTGKIVRLVPTLPDKAQKLVLGMVDIVLYCDFEAVAGPDGKQVQKRVFRTKPNIHYEAGDRTKRLPETIDFEYAAFLKCFETASPPPAAGVQAASAAGKSQAPVVAAAPAVAVAVASKSAQGTKPA